VHNPISQRSPISQSVDPSTLSRRARFALVAASLALAGCAGAMGEPSLGDGTTFDPQACAEDALRRTTDPELAAQAVETFSTACALRDTSSCSMLGVAYQIGVGVARNPARARGLYRHACEGGNKRACGNLGEMLLVESEAHAEPIAALGLLQASCAAGQARPCAVLGRFFAVGPDLPRDAASAVRFSMRGCTLGASSACVDLADMIDRGVAPAYSGRAKELVTLACMRGDEQACARLAPVKPTNAMRMEATASAASAPDIATSPALR
jgi:hypothetical protein